MRGNCILNEELRNPLSGKEYKKIDQNLQVPHENNNLLADYQWSLISSNKMALYIKIEKWSKENTNVIYMTKLIMLKSSNYLITHFNSKNYEKP